MENESTFKEFSKVFLIGPRPRETNLATKAKCLYTTHAALAWPLSDAKKAFQKIAINLENLCRVWQCLGLYFVIKILLFKKGSRLFRRGGGCYQQEIDSSAQNLQSKVFH